MNILVSKFYKNPYFLIILEDLIETSIIRKYLAMQMIPNRIEIIDSILEEDKKIIVFCSFTDELLELHNHYKNISVVHYGELNEKQKQNRQEPIRSEVNETK